MTSISPDTITTILFQVAIGGIGGFLIGYTFRKMIRITLIIGLAVFTIIFLAYTNIIKIDYSELISFASQIVEVIDPAYELMTPLLANIPFIISLFFGLFIGFRKED
ncbi:hypothetical protein E2P47_04015 [Candidatus Bathyarchaeota archaeon]|nr:hypothetical protein E2P47_04015 [Candidatus Bathyarchaeota archaeon]